MSPFALSELDVRQMGKALSVALFAYGLGCFTAGYYLVRLRTGLDVRNCVSGSVGAKNVGRVLGVPGFALTFMSDFGKGALAVWLAVFVGLAAWGQMLALLAVVVGHIWPAQLRFHGGKGIATSLGALLVFDVFNDHSLLLAVICLFGGMVILLRSYTLSGILAFAIAPFVCFALKFPPASVTGLWVLSVLVLIAHRRNIRDELARLLWQNESEEEHSSPP
jgi:glycerol-3-phosphate acyltransferase PlsY